MPHSPSHLRHPASEQRGRVRRSTPPTPEHRRILLIEDNDELRALIAARLRADDFLVVEGRTGADLLEHVGELLSAPTQPHFDLIVSDIRLPLVSGLEVVEGLRQAGCAIPCLLMTAFPDSATQGTADQLRVPLLHKPFRVDELRRAVRAILCPA